MNERIYTINELKSLIAESAKEFKAKIGDGIESENKKENNKTYKDAKNKVNNFDGGGEEDKHERILPEKEDGNKTTLDYSLEGNPGKNCRDKVKAQAEGYTSTLEKNNGIEKIGDFSDKTYKQFKKAGEKLAKDAEDVKKRGLTASKAPADTFKKDNMYETKKIAVLNFKNTKFLSESHMISRIPDDYKVEGKKFKMKDAAQNEFIVEWKEGEANILLHENKQKFNESVEKFHKLIDYKSQNFFKKSSSQTRLNEENEFNKMINKSRIIKNND